MKMKLQIDFHNNLAFIFHTIYYKGIIDKEELPKLIQSSVRIQCKQEPNSGVEQMVVKLLGCNAAQMGMLYEFFPNFNHIFLTRHPRPTIASLMPIFREEDIFEQPFPYDEGNLDFEFLNFCGVFS